jgi:hypothetical protein
MIGLATAAHLQADQAAPNPRELAELSGLPITSICS